MEDKLKAEIERLKVANSILQEQVEERGARLIEARNDAEQLRDRIMRVRANLDHCESVLHVTLEVSPALFFTSKEDDQARYIKRVFESMLEKLRRGMLPYPWQKG